MNKIISGEGPKPCNLLLIGQNPGKLEQKHGRPFVELAPAGSELTARLKAIGLKRSDIYVTNLYKCYLPRDPTPDEIESHLPFLDYELNRVDPDIIVTLGAPATRHFLEDTLHSVTMERCHGIPYPVNGRVVLPIYHPAAGLHNPEMAIRVIYGFQQLKALLDGVLEPYPPEDQYPQPHYREITNPEEVDDIMLWANVIACDTEGWRDRPWGLSFSVAAGHGYVLRNPDCIRAFSEGLRSENLTLILHNALHDLGVLRAMGVQVPRYTDTMVMSYLLRAEPQGLKALAYRHCGMDMSEYREMVAEAKSRVWRRYMTEVMEHTWDTPDPVLTYKPNGDVHIKQPQGVDRLVKAALRANEKNPEVDLSARWRNWDDVVVDPVMEKLGSPPEVTLDDISEKDAIWYSARDADATLRVLDALESQIKSMKLTQVLEMDLAVLPLVDRMMEVGMKVDIPYLLKMGEELGKEMEDITYQVRNLTKGIIINPGSGDQVARYLYEHQNIRPPKLTKSKARGSVSGEVLETLKMRVDDPVLDLIMDYKEREKVKGTYADQLPHWVKDDSRVHATLRATRVASGRFSSTDPNLLAQPKRSELGKRIRGGFVAPKGCVLFSADLSQIELRVLAHESQDERLLDVFRHGRDLHDETEQRVFGTSGKRRIAAKTCNFGIVYGLTSRGLQMQLRKGGIDWTTEECQEAIDGWFRSYPKVWEYQDKMVAHARRYGYVKDMWGRIRYLPAAKSTNRWLRAEAERVAGNHGIQAGAQGVIKRAMKAVWEWLPQMTGTECLLQIHDELLFQCPTQDVELLDIMVRSCLTTTTSLSVPIEADSSWGKRWSDL